jgi:hypothetical protein
MGQQGAGEIQAQMIDQLPDIREQYRAAVGEPASMGVGMSLDEASRALKVAHRRGGDRIVLYTPDLQPELDAPEQQEGDDPNDVATRPANDGPVLQKAAFGNPSIQRNSPSPGEATAIQRGDASPTAAQPSPPEQPSASLQDPQAGGQPPEGDPQQLKAAVVQVLQKAKEMGPLFEKMKQQNPELFAVMMGSIQSMIQMAKILFGTSSAPVQKSEKTEESSESTDEETKLEKETLPARHHLVLPPGSEHNQRVKVVHADGKTSWVSVRAGQVMSQDATGHPISSRNPGGR